MGEVRLPRIPKPFRYGVRLSVFKPRTHRFNTKFHSKRLFAFHLYRTITRKFRRKSSLGELRAPSDKPSKKAKNIKYFHFYIQNNI